MRRNARALLARLEAEAATGEFDPELDGELERSNRQAVERMEADPTGRLALVVLDRIAERHGIGDDDLRSGGLVKAALGYDAGIVALDLIGRFLDPPVSAREPPDGDRELLRRFLEEHGYEEDASQERR
jgi:hypothetical protein